MKFKYLFIITFSIISQSLYAQTMFRDGYIIKNSADTIKGKIDYRGDLLMASICGFQSFESDSIIKYSPDELIGYRFNEGKFFVSKEIEGKKIFLEFLIKGSLNAYFLRQVDGDHYYIENEKLKLSEITYKEYVIQKEGEQYLYKSTKHLGLLKLYMPDAPQFENRINNLKYLNRTKLVNIAKDYHYAVCEDEVCVIYEKKVFKFRPSLEFIYGTTFRVSGVNTSILHGGVLLNVWLPKTNEKLYFRTGIVPFGNTSNLDFSVRYKIPLQIEYIYPKGRIRPKFAYGISIYKPLFHTISFMGGVNIKLNEVAFLSVNYDVDFVHWEKIAILPTGKSVFHSLSIGFFINLTKN